jgi:hypothetical protein
MLPAVALHQLSSAVVAQAAVLVVFIQEVGGSNLCRDTGYND